MSFNSRLFLEKKHEFLWKNHLSFDLLDTDVNYLKDDPPWEETDHRGIFNWHINLLIIVDLSSYDELIWVLLFASIFVMQIFTSTTN